MNVKRQRLLLRLAKSAVTAQVALLQSRLLGTMFCRRITADEPMQPNLLGFIQPEKHAAAQIVNRNGLFLPLLLPARLSRRTVKNIIRFSGKKITRLEWTI